MKEGWTYKKLGEVANVTDYVANGSFATLRENVHYLDKAGFAILVRLADYTNNFDSTRFVYIDEHAYNFLSKSKLYGGEIIMSNVGSIGKSFICPILSMPMSLAPNSIVINTPNNKFYFYFFNSPSFQNSLKTISSKTALPKFNKTQFKTLIAPIPPLAEQERIVAELDLLSSIIEKKKAQLKELDQLAQSIFYDMFGDPITNEKGWEVKKLGESVHEMFLGPFGSSLKVDSYVAKEESYCMVYEQKHAIQGTISLDNHYINKDKYESLKRFEVKPNDFIMSCRGTIGRLFQLPHNAPLGIIHPSLMKIRIKDEVYNAAYFQFMLVKIVANENTNGNCVQMAITAKQLSKKELTIPPLPLQQEFADKVEAIERQKTLIQQSIVETQTLFDSRMYYWFD